GTQLTMRTFHIGGVASGGEGQTRLHSGFDGTVHFKDLELIEDKGGSYIAMNRTGSIQILDAKKREKAVYPVTYGSKVIIPEAAKVAKGDLLLQWDPFANAILTKEAGRVELKDLEENISYVQDRDEITGKLTTIIIDIKNEKLRDELQPQIIVRAEDTNKIIRRFYLPVNAHLSVKDGDIVSAGDVLAKIPSEFAKTKDITGGLPRVTELFEARKPKNPARMAQIDGRVEYGKLMKGSRKIIIQPHDKNGKPDEHNIPRGAYIIVGDGDNITAGTPLMDGPLTPIDI
ncbi:MAG: DNA-directed RNA polymerase subunit beta', partial [bacterium]|nr:DNA-directed RNA polymerase subunit beta' [bacterium]